MIESNSAHTSIESTTNFSGTELASFLSLFNGFMAYILTLRMNPTCFKEAKPFLDFYTLDLSTAIVFESYF